MSIRITDKATGSSIDASTVDFLEEKGGSAQLIAMLRSAVGNSEGIDIGWREA